MVQQSVSRMTFALLWSYVLLGSFVSFVLRRDWIGHANWQFAPVSASPLTQLTHASLRGRSNISKLRCHFKLDGLPSDWVKGESCSYADKVQCIRNSFGNIWSLCTYWDWGRVMNSRLGSDVSYTDYYIYWTRNLRLLCQTQQQQNHDFFTPARKNARILIAEFKPADDAKLVSGRAPSSLSLHLKC